MTIQSLLAREQVIKAIRTFFDNEGFQEITIPVLSTAIPVEPNIYSFTTEWETIHGNQTLYLSTSPERSLKIALAQGVGNCYAIGHTFRNLEQSGPKHNPEFLMLEWYRQDADYHQIMQDTQHLLLYVKQQMDLFLQRDESSILEFDQHRLELGKTWAIISLEKTWNERMKVKLREVIEGDKLFQFAFQKGYMIKDATWSEVFDQLFLNEIEESLPTAPFFLVDFPSRISPLCTPQPKKPYLAQRFEVFIANMELGNGNTENTDVETIRKRIEMERAERERKQQHISDVDEIFLNALKEMQKKQYAGIGLGVDRVAMMMSNSTEIFSF